MVWILLVSIVYFYFNWQYFRMVNRLMEITHRQLGLVLTSFIINYALFYLCSKMQLPPILNWILLAFLLLLLLLETLLYNHGNFRYALFCTLIGVIFGLSINILCRSVISIVTNQPLQSFDNRSAEADNLKGLPVFLGFLIGGIAFRCFTANTVLKRFRLIAGYPRHQSFFMQIMAGLFIYLFLNLLLYSTPLNDTLLKVWSIKSCLFCVCGFYIAARYTRRICELDDYREKNRDIERELLRRREDEELLRRKASMDVLTGLFNRQYGEERVAAMMEEKRFFTLCFLDIDKLKNVNDQYGHAEGDRYIRIVTNQILGACRTNRDFLFRYGGDEFLLVFAEMELEKVEERLRAVEDKLLIFRSEQAIQYSLSFSYGLIENTDYLEWNALIQAADERMYRQKQQKYGGDVDRNEETDIRLPQRSG